MKKHFLRYLTAFFIGVAVLYGLFLGKSPWGSRDSQNTSKIGRVLLPGEEACGDTQTECPTLKKINDKISFLNDITAMPMMIENEGGSTGILVNFPAVSATNTDQNQILDRIKNSQAKKITLGFAGSYIYAEEREIISNIFSKNNFDEIHIRLYVEPINMIEIFDLIHWKQSRDMKIGIEFINVDLPEDLNLYEYLYLADKMIKRNNNTFQIQSLSIMFDPKFYEFGLIDRYIMDPSLSKILQDFPTHSLLIEGIGKKYYNSRYAVDPVGAKGDIQYFFDMSPIQNISIENVGKKVQGVTHIQ